MGKITYIKRINAFIKEIEGKEYKTGGFKIIDYHGDNEFNTKTLVTSLLPGLQHIYAKKGIIEWSIYTTKEREIGTCHGVPLNRYKSLMKRSLIEGLLDLVNRFPYKCGVSDTLSLSTIVEGRLKVDMVHK